MEASLTKTRIFEIYLNVIETPGLLRRQRLILGRMGVVTPPPDVAMPTDEPAKAEEPNGSP